MDEVNINQPEMMRKQKIHLLLHLVECIEQFGPTSSERLENHGNKESLPNIIYIRRCETFNSFIRAQNIYGNKRAPSRDIAHHFSTIEHLRYICDGGCINGERYN